MTNIYLTSAATGALVLIFLTSAAFADNAAQTPDKTGYTLFNPVLDDQLRDMDTDRPNATNTPHTVGAGHLQIETGFLDDTYMRDRSQGGDVRNNALTLGRINLRLGVLNNLEINATVDSFDVSSTTDHATGQITRQHGFGDMGIGAKLNLWGDDGADDIWSTGFAIQPQLSIPTAQAGLGSGHPEFSIATPLLIIMPAGFHLGLQAVASRQRNGANTAYVTGWQGSASIDRVFGTFDIYLEYWVQPGIEAHAETQSSVDIGFTYPLTPNLVLDTGLNFGLSRHVHSIEFTTGASVRF